MSALKGGRRAAGTPQHRASRLASPRGGRGGTAWANAPRTAGTSSLSAGAVERGRGSRGARDECAAHRSRRPISPHLISALWHLRCAFVANNRAKVLQQFIAPAREQDEILSLRTGNSYWDKEHHIRCALSLIHRHALPIKYGVHGRITDRGTARGDVIIYFEYLGRQVSFHVAYGGRVFTYLRKIKKYKGEWEPTVRWVVQNPHIDYHHPGWTRAYPRAVRLAQKQGEKLRYAPTIVRTTRFPMERILRAYIARNKELHASNRR